MGIEEVAGIIHKIAEGFEESCRQCLSDNSGVVLTEVREQLYAGLDGNGEYLSPTYDNDPFFNEEGYWHNRAADYKAWKLTIMWTNRNRLLGLDQRPDEVPNLFIDGTFYFDITAARRGDVLVVDPGSGNGPDIVEKYGDQILNLGRTAVEYFNEELLLPSIARFFKNCGYT